MKMIQKFVIVLTLLIATQIAAQETKTIENFQLPTFLELSNDIATDYRKVLESLPDLAAIGKYVKKDIRRGFLDENSIRYTFQNFSRENSILPNISVPRFQLRNNLNNIMFTGFDVNQLHLNEAYKGTN